ncbi:MAG: GspE/PulE family protein [Patescibacteria group bacterium]|nr:GspE/PulE family protein [Patescibacteria group bacterium]
MPDIDLTLQQFAREDEERHAKEIAQKLKLPYINLVGYPVAPEVLAIIPEEQARRAGVVSYLRAGNVIKVATTDPQSPAIKPLLEQLQAASHNEFVIAYCSKTSLLYGLHLYKILVPETPKEEKVEVTKEKEANFEEEIKTFEDLKEKITQVSTTELLDLVFAGAVKNDASDIHIEPEEKNFRIRFRIDGVLHSVATLPPSTFKQILSRIKYLAKLKLDVTHPQDGRFEIQVLKETVDIRVATLPTSYGEAVVMRLLPKNKKFTDLETLGFNKSALALIDEAISKPQGMILNTGPTGSGKTTTLYAILQKLNTTERKIITLENPIEYRLQGVEQIQIDLDNKTSFLDALKGSLRQNPDTLMVGEIRDEETANIALQAAMTGHLVLSTLHTNNAPASLARLSEMGIEPYLLAGSINLIIAQRLVRTLHKECGGKGCQICQNTGFKGRTAIVEVLVPSKEIEELIYKKAPLRTFEETAHKLGMKTMYEDGMEKVAAGITTQSEIERVTKE